MSGDVRDDGNRELGRFGRLFLSLGGELALKGVFSVGFPASLLGGFPCALEPKNGRKFTGDGPP